MAELKPFIFLVSALTSSLCIAAQLEAPKPPVLVPLSPEAEEFYRQGFDLYQDEFGGGLTREEAALRSAAEALKYDDMSRTSEEISGLLRMDGFEGDLWKARKEVAHSMDSLEALRMLSRASFSMWFGTPTYRDYEQFAALYIRDSGFLDPVHVLPWGMWIPRFERPNARKYLHTYWTDTGIVTLLPKHSTFVQGQFTWDGEYLAVDDLNQFWGQFLRFGSRPETREEMVAVRRMKAAIRKLDEGLFHFLRKQVDDHAFIFAEVALSYFVRESQTPSHWLEAFRKPDLLLSVELSQMMTNPNLLGRELQAQGVDPEQWSKHAGPIQRAIELYIQELDPSSFRVFLDPKLSVNPMARILLAAAKGSGVQLHDGPCAHLFSFF